MSGRISPWQAVPDTPDLPPANHSGTVQVSGIDLWYAAFGLSLEESKKRQISPVVFLHGGQISSQWWGLQISYLVEQDAYSIFALDSRAQG
jgi:pimeloyl-ACP methyl ester carboxylesterase